MYKKVIALDFDGTLCIGNNFPDIGKPRKWLIDKAIQWKKDGHKLILWTCREDILPEDYSPNWAVGSHLTEAVDWCKKQGLEFHAVNINIAELIDPRAKFSRKILADLYIDDKAFIFDDTSGSIIGMNLNIFSI